MTHSLILGGIRSGKSAHAEAAATHSGRAITYVATATAGDGEMAQRIREHQARRPQHWGLVEEPLTLGRVLREHSHKAPCLLIDCMSLWLNNLLEAGEPTAEREISDFRQALSDYPGPVVIVSNEVGLSTVAMDALTRRFIDRLGWLNQELARQCHQVLLVAAGLPLTLKDEAG
jgi:adenosylcobinamide kinase/adenosylcobinamide-phosphate guanylyltransferase